MDKKIEVIPYLSFKGNCEEAVNAYINAFGGKIIWMSRWTENNFDTTPEQIGKVMHVEFDLGSTRMAGGDSVGCAEVKTDISLMVHMDSETEALHAISVLAEGGTILSPLKPHPEPDDGGCGSFTKTGLVLHGSLHVRIRRSSKKLLEMYMQLIFENLPKHIFNG